MSLVILLLVLLPFLSALVLGMMQDVRRAAWINAGSATLTFLMAGALPFGAMAPGSWLYPDRLAVHFTILTAFIGCTTAWYSLPYIAAELAAARLDAPRSRLYHACFQIMLGAMLVAILSDNLGLTWVAIEAATIAGVIVVGLPRTAEAIEASWKYFITCGVGVALALFGTVVIAFAAEGVVPAGDAMSWHGLLPAAAHLRGTTLNLAFTFLLVGYGTKAALAPLHNWMPDAHTEGPTPVSAVLSSSIMNVALLILLRLRVVLDANHMAGGGAIAPGPVLAVLGIASVLVGALGIWRRRAVKRFFAFSSIEQNGIAATAIGLGITAPALLHITLHTLTKSALFQCAGLAAQRKNSNQFAGLGGLLQTDRALAIVFGAGMIALTGLPPFGLFTSEFQIVTGTVQAAPLVCLPLGFGILVGAWALIVRLQKALLGAPTPGAGPRISPWRLIPAWMHLALVVGLGFAPSFGLWLRSLAP